MSPGDHPTALSTPSGPWGYTESEYGHHLQTPEAHVEENLQDVLGQGVGWLRTPEEEASRAKEVAGEEAVDILAS